MFIFHKGEPSNVIPLFYWARETTFMLECIQDEYYRHLDKLIALYESQGADVELIKEHVALTYMHLDAINILIDTRRKV